MTKQKRYLSILKGGLLGVFFFLFLSPSAAWAKEPCIPRRIPPDWRIDQGLVCILGRAIESLFGLVVPIAVVLLIIGGFRYMASGGDQRAMESTKKFLTWVIIGTVLALGSVFIFKIINMIIEKS